MGHQHSPNQKSHSQQQHSHQHHSHHHHSDDQSDRQLTIAVMINVLLTVAQIIGGIVSGSLSLIADALHNLSDAAAIFIALVARKIGNKPADDTYHFGYKRLHQPGN